MESMNLFENNTTEKAEEKKNSMNRKMIKQIYLCRYRWYYS